jgi:hypothetical protein
MSIRKPQSFLREPVNVRRVDLRVRIQGTHIAVIEVVGKDEYDVSRLFAGIVRIVQHFADFIN